ncbi:hypothetical protein KIH87_01955 [Paraneptunicella aestuarii]|uniref:hypothetical protein n=1 Tax=Paraneptunicella aestuarii TaxID=2831148 RepID=UPI001E3C08CD|nr:hypothetical protein [Paraneptunicella aestuarii]UAA39153.1 hypothetical protein KIH87_01955 [Paraneptunicella aestuarii]
MSNIKYSDHVDVLLALVTNLAMTDKASLTPRRLAKYLNLEEQEVCTVLDGFPGLFRKSRVKEKNPPEGKVAQHFYTLQIRYSRRYLELNGDDDDPNPQEPLSAELFNSLVRFISEQVNLEHENDRLTKELSAAHERFSKQLAEQEKSLKASIDAQNNMLKTKLESDNVTLKVQSRVSIAVALIAAVAAVFAAIK